MGKKKPFVLYFSKYSSYQKLTCCRQTHKFHPLNVKALVGSASLLTVTNQQGQQQRWQGKQAQAKGPLATEVANEPNNFRVSEALLDQPFCCRGPCPLEPRGPKFCRKPCPTLAKPPTSLVLKAGVSNVQPNTILLCTQHIYNQCSVHI